MSNCKHRLTDNAECFPRRYDDSYDRNLSPPNSTCDMLGTEVVYDETVDINMDLLSGGGSPGYNPSSLNVQAMPNDIANDCKPVKPHAFVKVNTLFEVLKGKGMYTAWCDKHPGAYGERSCAPPPSCHPTNRADRSDASMPTVDAHPTSRR